METIQKEKVKLTAKVKKGNEASRHMFAALGYEEMQDGEICSYRKSLE